MSAVTFGKSAEQSPITIVDDFLNSLNSSFLNVSTSHNVGGDFSKFTMTYRWIAFPRTECVDVFVSPTGFLEIVSHDSKGNVEDHLFFGVGQRSFSEIQPVLRSIVLDKFKSKPLAEQVNDGDLGRLLGFFYVSSQKPKVLPSEQYAQWQQLRNNRDGVALDGSIIPHLG